MLIAAVMALAVLMIIIGAIQYFDDQQFGISKERFFDGVQNAVRQPNGELLVVEQLQFKKGDSFSSNGVGKNAGISGECITFSGTGTNGAVVSPDGESISFAERVLVDAFIKCSPASPAGGTCEAECEISFEEP